jgi:hypothetical protein
MMTLMPLPPSPAYTLVEELHELAAPTHIHTAAPEEWAQDELLLRKLGSRGWGRVYYFRHFYTSGWGEHAGPAPSPKALGAFYQFVECAAFPSGTVPSVFLTDRGGVELSWEDADGKSVQVEFTRTGAEFFREATGEEDTVPLAEAPHLWQRLAS